MTRSKARIVLNVSGGVVQDVFCSDPEAEVIVVDWETEGCDSSRDDVVEIEGRGTAVFVAHPHRYSLQNLTGTVVEAALRAAGVAI
jgi:hypothetical protein